MRTGHGNFLQPEHSIDLCIKNQQKDLDSIVGMCYMMKGRVPYVKPVLVLKYLF